MTRFFSDLQDIVLSDRNGAFIVMLGVLVLAVVAWKITLPFIALLGLTQLIGNRGPSSDTD
jgi:hypothetical protein